MNTATQKKILMIEDDPMLLSAVQDALTRAGFAVIKAENGMDGLVLAGQMHPDLILLDILMPVMDGWEMLKRLRAKDDWGKCVPVVVLTNLSPNDEAQMRNITELGPSFFMEKANWTVEGVVDRVREALGIQAC